MTCPRPALVFLLALAVLKASPVRGPQAGVASQQRSRPGDSAAAHFTLIRMADGTFEGTYGTTKTYKAEDGEIVWLVLRHFSSKEDALRLFNVRVRKALAVIKTEHTLNSLGERNWQTAVLRATGSKGEKSFTEVAMLSGGEFRDVLSYSASDAAALAKP
jgi:hypothetical protein